MAEEEEARVTALLACKLVRQFSACKADRTRVMLQELQSEAEAARAEFCTLSANQCKSSNQERRLFPCWRIYDSSFLRSAAKSSPPPAFTWIISRSTASACFTLPAERIWRFGGHDLEDTIWNDLEGIVAKRKHGRYNAERQVGSSLRIRLTRRLAAEKNCLKEESLRAGFGQESTIGLVAPIF